MRIACIIAYLIVCISTQRSIIRLTQTSYKQTKAQPPIRIECEAVDDHHDKQHHFLCVDKKYEWILDGLQLDYHANKDQVIIEIQNQDAQDAAFIAKLKEVMGSVWLIQAQLVKNQVDIHYVGIEQDPITGNFSFPHIQIPDSIKSIQSEIRKQVERQVFELAPRKSMFLRYVFYVIIAFVIIVIAAYFWKRKQMSAQIQKSNDMKQVMMTNIQLKEQQNRRPGPGIVRSSQPPKKPVNF